MYATQDDFITAFGEDEAIALTNLEDPDLRQVDFEMLNRALDDANAEASGYLQAAGYSLPLSSAPLVLRNKCCDIARYRLDRNRPRDDVRQRYEDAMKYFRDLVSGVVRLPISMGGTDGNDAIEPRWYTSDRVFTMSSLRGY